MNIEDVEQQLTRLVYERLKSYKGDPTPVTGVEVTEELYNWGRAYGLVVPMSIGTYHFYAFRGTKVLRGNKDG